MTARFAILTVCTGNVHRSPLAAALLRTWAGWYLSPPLAAQVIVRSAGLAAPVGSPMSSRIQAVARSLGADGSTHRATQIADGVIASSQLVLVATRRQRDEVLNRVPAALRTTFTISEAGAIAAMIEDRRRPQGVPDLAAVVAELADRRGLHSAPDGGDIVDPQGLDLDAYVQMTREEVIPLTHLAELLLGMPAADVAAYRSAAEDSASLRALLAGVTSPEGR
jgi:protein-tyrosine phosphatase